MLVVVLFVRKQQHPCAKIEVIVQIDQPGRDEFGFWQQMPPLLLLLIQHRRYNISKSNPSIYTQTISPWQQRFMAYKLRTEKWSWAFCFSFIFLHGNNFTISCSCTAIDGPSIGRNDYLFLLFSKALNNILMDYPFEISCPRWNRFTINDLVYF